VPGIISGTGEQCYTVLKPSAGPLSSYLAAPIR
jgi:hypothetical protein